MKVTITQDGEETLLDLAAGSTILDALSEMEIPPDIVLTFMGGKPVPIDTLLQDGDVVKLLVVVSGG